MPLTPYSALSSSSTELSHSYFPQYLRTNSSNTHSSGHSSNASAYLTPPEDAPDTDTPPYKHRRDSESLNMVEKRRSLYSQPAPPVETRRWSSVEIGAESFPSYSPTSNSNRSSLYHRTDEDFIDGLRSKLMTRKVPKIQIDTPATITLRRASGTSSSDSLTRQSPWTSPRSRSANPPKDSFSKVWRSWDQRKPSEYLVTSAEIDSITRLIETNLKKSRSRQHSPNCHTPSECLFQPRTPVHRPSVCNGFISVQRGVPADAATTVSEATTRRNHSKSAPAPLRRQSSDVSVSRILSASSVHEIVWDGVTSPSTLKSMMSTVSADGFRYEKTHSLYDPSTPGYFTPGPSWTTKITACGPKNGHMSPLASPMVSTSFEWSESKPSNASDDTPKATSPYSTSDTETPGPSIPLIVTGKESTFDPPGSQTSSMAQLPGPKAQSPGKSSKLKAASRTNSHKKSERTQNPFISAVTTQLLDVESFPALPTRQKTSDWISPLPDMSAPIPMPGSVEYEAVKRKTLTFEFDTSHSSPIMQHDQRDWADHAVTPLSLPGDRLTLDTKSMSLHHDNGRLNAEPRPKSVVIQHPSANLSRKSTAEKGMAGTALGISSGRRKSSGNVLKSVTARSSEDLGTHSEIVTALIKGSESETDLRRKSLSQHAGEQRVKTRTFPSDDRSCLNHSPTRMERLRGGVGDSPRQSPEPRNSPFLNMINNTIPGGISLLSKSRPTLSRETSSKSRPPLSRTTSSKTRPPLSRTTSSRSTRPLLSREVSSSPVATSSSPNQQIHQSPSLSRLSYVTKNQSKNRSLADRLSLIEEKSKPSVEVDCVGIYITMTGARRGGDIAEGAGEGDALCRVGCESHNCGEGVGDGVDWIG